MLKMKNIHYVIKARAFQHITINTEGQREKYDKMGTYMYTYTDSHSVSLRAVAL